ncbi:Conserved_hypothetical protein [Hexamita inflata]|uniref:t-SNARE coiled-coil homology domain-containing protein n=1 Tax=Hexamita inflata TaxID=28002 RepID=A0AA86P3W0_9EUKA|nr:Conserved hypothetical protein [Hexamita inflata]CAI9930335.1 Conserved hypothetical protein [Hexamita inflata]CAI9978024.1 Conserved hypothetical protein [Hexamita inflata]
MDFKQILLQIDKLEQQLTQQNQLKSLPHLVQIQQQATQVASHLHQLQTSSIQKQLALDRIQQVQSDLEMLISKNEPQIQDETVDQELNQLMQDKESAKHAHRLLDETLDLANNSLVKLKEQGEKLHAIHDKVVSITSKLMIGDKQLSKILMLENFGAFIGIIGTSIIIILWILFKFIL